MGARFRSWWQKIKRPLLVGGIIVASILVIALIIAIIGGYLFHWSGTGVSQKTLWDWLQLLIVPFVLAIIALVFQLANSRTERQIAKQRYAQDQQITKQRYEQDQQIALNKQLEDLLQAYLDRISELLLHDRLRQSKLGDEVRNVARVRTTTILTQLDARRISYVFAFLREAGLMSTTSNSSVVSLSEADFSHVNWSQANLREADISGAKLFFANLREADFYRANLSGVDLSLANLNGAGLNKANLSGASLVGAKLQGAVLQEANLSGAKLLRADLSRAALHGANFSGANLYGADLSRARLISGVHFSGVDPTEANLSGVDLSEANLSDAIVTEEQLEKAESLKGATMPDGSKHP